MIFLFQRWKPHGISRSLEGMLPQLQHSTFRRTAKSDAVHTFNGGNVKTLLRWVRIFPMNRSTTCDDPFGGGTPGNPPCLSTWFFRHIIKLNFRRWRTWRRWRTQKTNTPSHTQNGRQTGLLKKSCRLFDLHFFAQIKQCSKYQGLKKMSRVRKLPQKKEIM